MIMTPAECPYLGKLIVDRFVGDIDALGAAQDDVLAGV
jgi:hypothetical protein